RAARPDTGDEMAHEQPYGTPDHGTPDRARPGAVERRGRRGLRAPQDAPVDTTDWTAYRPTPLLDAAPDKAVTIPSRAIRAHVASVRRRSPEGSPARIGRIREREYLLVIQTAGGAGGAAAAIPSGGTGAGVALTSSAVATFFASSAALALAVADV